MTVNRITFVGSVRLTQTNETSTHAYKCTHCHECKQSLFAVFLWRRIFHSMHSENRLHRKLITSCKKQSAWARPNSLENYFMFLYFIKKKTINFRRKLMFDDRLCLPKSKRKEHKPTKWNFVYFLFASNFRQYFAHVETEAPTPLNIFVCWNSISKCFLLDFNVKCNLLASGHKWKIENDDGPSDDINII